MQTSRFRSNSSPSPSPIMPPANHTNPSKLPQLNDRIAVFWPIDQQFFPGVVTQLNQDETVVHYDDGDVETLNLTQEIWNFLPDEKEKPPFVRRGVTSNSSRTTSNQHATTAPVTTVAPRSRKRTAPSSFNNPLPKKPITPTPQLARPITSGVPLSNNLDNTPLKPSLPSPNFQQALEPLMTSFNAQLNTQVTRISTIRDMLLNLSPTLSELDQRCKILRADVDNLESEVTSRAEMHKLLNAAFGKQMDELNRSQALILERLKIDFRQFLQGEMKAVESHLVEEIRTKSAEVFKELFRGVAESIKDTAVKNVIEDMSIPTCPSKKNGKKQGGGPSTS